MNSNNIPNPYVSQNMEELPEPNSNPGFLLMTRPSSASFANEHNQSYGTVRPVQSPSNEDFISFGNRSSNRPNSHQYTPRGKNYNNRGYNNSYHSSPGFNRSNRFSSPNRFQSSPPNRFQGTPPNRFQSTPPNRFQSTPKGNFRGGRSFHSSPYSNRPMTNRFSFNKSQHNTPLKEIPIEKFISKSMIQNPWSEFENELNQ